MSWNGHMSKLYRLGTTKIEAAFRDQEMIFDWLLRRNFFCQLLTTFWHAEKRGFRILTTSEAQLRTERANERALVPNHLVDVHLRDFALELWLNYNLLFRFSILSLFLQPLVSLGASDNVKQCSDSTHYPECQYLTSMKDTDTRVQRFVTVQPHCLLVLARGSTFDPPERENCMRDTTCKCCTQNALTN